MAQRKTPLEVIAGLVEGWHIKALDILVALAQNGYTIHDTKETRAATITINEHAHGDDHQ